MSVLRRAFSSDLTFGPEANDISIETGQVISIAAGSAVIATANGKISIATYKHLNLVAGNNVDLLYVGPVPRILGAY